MSPRNKARHIAISLVTAFIFGGASMSVHAANSMDGDLVAPKRTANSGYGSYLAGLYARAVGDSRSAAAFYGEAIADDPSNLELKRKACAEAAEASPCSSCTFCRANFAKSTPNSP